MELTPVLGRGEHKDARAGMPAASLATACHRGCMVNLTSQYCLAIILSYLFPVDSVLQVALLLFADQFWKKVQRQWPQVLGKENPFNSQIEEVFGDQGGH